MIFDVLDPDTDVFGPHFLEASAGTGKTFAIENIIPRLLLEAKEPLSIEQILVVTFTRAATRELRSRIYQNLVRIAKALEAGQGGPKYLEKFFSLGPLDLMRAKHKIEEALFSFEKAQIFTLHGFCLSALQERAFETEFCVTAEQEEELVKTQGLKKYIQDFFRAAFSSDRVSPSQVRRLSHAKGLGKDIEALSTFVIKMLGRGQKIKTYPEARDQWLLWNATLRSLPRIAAKDLLEDLSLAFPKMHKSAKWRPQAEVLFSFIEKGESSFEEWDSFLEGKELFLQELKSSAKKGEEKSRPGIFEELKKRLVPHYVEATDTKMLLLRLIQQCEKHYEKGKKELSHYSPDDFVHRLQESLDNQNVRKKIQDQYQVLIIDEFQDTDAKQWDIFKTLFFAKETPCLATYLVGDPKQSIYRFRSADVYIYLRAKECFPSEACFYLSTNYRSHPHFIHALNALFSLSLPERWLLLPQLSTGLEVKKVEAKPMTPSSLDGEVRGRIHFFIQGKTKDGQELVAYIAEEILRLNRERRISFQEIAVLVKDRYQADLVQKGFHRYGISCQMPSHFSVKHPAYGAMKDLVLALIHPSDISAIKRVLGGILIGCQEEAIAGPWENPLLQRTREYFAEASFVLKKKGFGVFFSKFFESSFIEEYSVGELLLQREDSSIYFFMRQLMQVILQGGEERLYDPNQIFAFLRELEDPARSEKIHLPLELEKDQVQVMTLHKSKGLEFGIVFALGLGERHAGRDSFMLSVKDQEIIPLKEEDEEYLLQTRELDAEKLRQLYVALTRAKERVYIPLILAEDKKGVPFGTASPIELFLYGFGLKEPSLDEIYTKEKGLIWDELRPHLDKLGKEASITYEVIEAKKPSSPFTQHKEELIRPFPAEFSFARERLFSFSSLSEGRKQEEVFLCSREEDLPLGPDTGVVIHAILELLCKADLQERNGAFACQTVDLLCQGTLLEGKERAVLALVKKAFTLKITDGKEAFTLGSIPKEDMRPELEFFYPVPGGVMKGFIDLVFRLNGRYYLLDWKTNALEGYQEEDMIRCMETKQYGLQAAIYGEAIQRHLALFDKRPFDVCFGGVIYFFLRGGAYLLFQPDLMLVESACVKGDVWDEE